MQGEMQLSLVGQCVAAKSGRDLHELSKGMDVGKMWSVCAPNAVVHTGFTELDARHLVG